MEGFVWIVVIVFLVLVFMTAFGRSDRNTLSVVHPSPLDAGLKDELASVSGSSSEAPSAGRSSSDMPGTDLSHVPPKFVVFDLETTGLDPTRHEIIEVGAIRVNRDSDLHEANGRFEFSGLGFQALVKPRRRIPKRITQINGISQDMVDKEGEPLEAVLKDFAAFIGDLPLVSFNAAFDMGFLQNAARRHNIVFPNQASCALKLARRAWPGLPSYQLCDLAKLARLSNEDMHRALGDCKRTLLLYTVAASTLASDKAALKHRA